MSQIQEPLNSGRIREAPRVRVMRQLRLWIADGTFAGKPLPSERALAETLEVDRGTVRRAIAVLRAEGLLDDSQGRLRPALASKPGEGWMEHAIAVFTVDVSVQNPEEKGGSLEFITLGMLAGINEAGWHGITLHPSRLLGSNIERLLVQPPAAVLAGDFVFPDFDSTAALRRLHSLGVHVAVFGETGYEAFDRVTSDHAGGGEAVTKWLLERGRRRILQIGIEPGTAYWFGERRKGYLRALAAAGAEPLPQVDIPGRVIFNRADFDDHVRHVAGYLVPFLVGEHPVDAILAPTDIDVPTLAEACRLFGKVPNGDVWLAGYDHLWPDCRTRPFSEVTPLITVDKGNTRIGHELVRLLLARIAGELPPGPQFRVLPVEVVQLSQPV